MEGTDSTLTTEEQNKTGWKRKHHSRVTENIAVVQCQRDITFDFLVFSTSVFLRFCVNFCCRLCSNCCHSDSWDLVDNLHCLHHGSGAPCRRYDGWCRHGIGYRLDGCLRHGAMHSYQHWLVVEGGAYHQSYATWKYKIKKVSFSATGFSSTLKNVTFND